MEQPQHLVEQNFPLFKPSRKPSTNPSLPTSILTKPNPQTQTQTPQNDVVTHENPKSNPENTATTTFSDLGLSEWAVKTCKELGMKFPRRVQQYCIPKILEGRHVIGIDETGSGKTAAFALPILQRLDEHPFGVFALVITPTRELAFQLKDQFHALGSSVTNRIAVVVGGMDMLTQTKELVARPHLVIATPGRINVLLKDNPEIAPVFARTKVINNDHDEFS
jgi:ATP-dependent RNA helicase DDX49/DBP8